MQILWFQRFRPLPGTSVCVSLSTPFSPVDIAVHTVYRARAARAAAAAGRNAEELQWCHNLTSSLLLHLSSPKPLLPTHSCYRLHARVPVFMSGCRAQGQGRLEEDGAQLQPVSRDHGYARLEPTRRKSGSVAEKLGDGLYRDRYGLFHRVSNISVTPCLLCITLITPDYISSVLTPLPVLPVFLLFFPSLQAKECSKFWR